MASTMPLYSIREEDAERSRTHRFGTPIDYGTWTGELPITCIGRCQYHAIHFVLQLIAIILGVLTFVFALFLVPVGMYCGRQPSLVQRKHSIRKANGKFIFWGMPRHQYVYEYFVYGSKDPGADVLLLISGAGTPGSFWVAPPDENNVEVWSKKLNLRVICPSNCGLGASTATVTGLVEKEQLHEAISRVLEQEGLGSKGRFYLAGFSQGSHVSTLIAESFGSRVKGVLLMCPYMPFPKAHEVFCNGKKCEGDDYLNTSLADNPMHMMMDLLPLTTISFFLTQALPLLKHSYALFSTFTSGRMIFAWGDDILAALQRLDAEGTSYVVDAFLKGYERSKELNIYGESQIMGFGKPGKISQNGNIPVIVATDRNVTEIPDLVCASRYSWWWVENIPGAKLICANKGYGHMTPALYLNELMTHTVQEFRSRQGESKLGPEEQGVKSPSGSSGTVPTLVMSARSGTSARSRYRQRRDVWQWTDHLRIAAPDTDKNTPIPWVRRRQGDVFRSSFEDWYILCYIFRLHFGFAFLAALFGLSYSYTSYTIWQTIGVPLVFSAVGAVVFGPMLVLLIAMCVVNLQPTSPLKGVFNTAQVIVNGGSEASQKMERTLSFNTTWGVQGYLLFFVFIGANVMFLLVDEKGLGGAVPNWLFAWHILGTATFAFVAVHLLTSMGHGVRCIEAANAEIVSKMRTWQPDGGESEIRTSTLSQIASQVSLLDEDLVEKLSEAFASTVHAVLFSTFSFIGALVVFVLEDQTSLSPYTQAGVTMICVLFAMCCLTAKSLGSMAKASSSCSVLPNVANRLRLRMVEYYEDDVLAEGFDKREMEVAFKRVDALCSGISAHPIGFRLSGFVVTPALTISVLYSVAGALFLILARGNGSSSSSSN
jgi:pimeloyl-ACP methyl ester carboxylesterase